MENISIALARIAVLIELHSLDPHGANTSPESAHILARRYGFAQIPKLAEEMDYQKGVSFKAGRFDNIAIDQLQIFHNGLIIDTRSSTDDSARILSDLKTFAKEVNGATIAPKRMHFVSQIIFTSKLKLAILNPLLQPIADRLSAQTSKTLNHPIQYEPIAFLLGPETSQLKIVPSQFSMERRADTPFNENTYFSAAPLQTTEHIALVEEVEAALSPARHL
jgi:hypothetical protein